MGCEGERWGKQTRTTVGYWYAPKRSRRGAVRNDAERGRNGTSQAAKRAARSQPE